LLGLNIQFAKLFIRWKAGYPSASNEY